MIQVFVFIKLYLFLVSIIYQFPCKFMFGKFQVKKHLTIFPVSCFQKFDNQNLCFCVKMVVAVQYITISHIPLTIINFGPLKKLISDLRCFSVKLTFISKISFLVDFICLYRKQLPSITTF